MRQLSNLPVARAAVIRSIARRRQQTTGTSSHRDDGCRLELGGSRRAQEKSMEVRKAEGLEASACPASTGASSPLGDASLTDALIVAHPSEFYRSMRKYDPVYYDEKIGMFLVSRYEDVVAVLRDPITFSDKLGYEALYASGHFEEFKQILERDGGGFFPDAIKDDPPAHTRVRRLMEQAFTAHRVATLGPGITTIVVNLIEKLVDRAAKGELVDGVNDFAVPLTIAVICEQLGINQFSAHKIQRWSQAITAQISQMQDREQMCELQNFIIGEMKAREHEPREDMISDIVHAQLEDGGRLTFKEAVSLIRALIIAGNETTATAISNLLCVLAT